MLQFKILVISSTENCYLKQSESNATLVYISNFNLQLLLLFKGTELDYWMVFGKQGYRDKELALIYQDIEFHTGIHSVSLF